VSRKNERWVGDLSQHDYDALLVRLAEAEAALLLADGSLTWCRARHDGDEVLDEAIRAVTRITRDKAGGDRTQTRPDR
jgi:hypothetical protein